MNLNPVNPYVGVQYPQLNWSIPQNQTSAVPTQTYVQNIPSVNGLDEAKQLPIGKNASTMILDSNENVLYVKTTDSIGAITNFIAFRMEQMNLDPKTDSKTEDRLAKMENDISEIKRMLTERRNNGKQYSEYSKQKPNKSDSESQ